MIVEVIAVGTELLLGQIVNTNAAALGARLADEGFDAHFQVTVGDNLERLSAAVRTALARAHAVILTGGMGPTQDDLTREALCLITGREMARDEAHAQRLRQRLLAVGRPAPTIALRMADHPAGSDPLPNRNGAALGVALTHGGKLVFAVPGVPREMQVMVDEQVLPRLRAAIDEPTVLRSRVVKTWGHGESHIAEVLGDLYASANPSIAFLIDEAEVRVRISAKADDEGQAFALTAPVQQEIERRLGDSVFGYDEATGLGVLSEALQRRGWRIGVHEVATAGLLGARLAGYAGMPFAGATTHAAGEERSALDLAHAATEVFDATVGVGIGPAEDGVVAVGVVTTDGEHEHDLRLLGDGERLRAHAASSAVHVARLAVLAGERQLGGSPLR
jgi:nicotinamide-nucleotide amidase